MMVMPSSHSSSRFHYLCGKFPDRLGWLIGPSGLKKLALRSWVPFALDNDAFSAFANGKPWDALAWQEFILAIKRSGHHPMWALVPDVVCDKDATLEAWETYRHLISESGFPLAFAVQDGMTPDDITIDPHPDVIFVGGSTKWKWETLPIWCRHFRRVHVGRVNSIDRLVTCDELGVESCDGTGWFRDPGDNQKMNALESWLDGSRVPHSEMFELSELTK